MEAKSEMPRSKSETELRRLSELRALLEGFAARHAATRAASAPDMLHRLRLVLRRLSKAARARDYAAFRQADFELHQTMINLAIADSDGDGRTECIGGHGSCGGGSPL